LTLDRRAENEGRPQDDPPDGAFKNEMCFVRGFWQTKDTGDKLDAVDKGGGLPDIRGRQELPQLIRLSGSRTYRQTGSFERGQETELPA
jgi:hypothetical protein